MSQDDNNKVPSSIWPTWNKQEKKLDWHMPFNDRFWRSDEVRDELFTWNEKQRALETAPIGIQGFIVALPSTWTYGENNISGMNLSILANNSKSGADQEGGRYASSDSDASQKISGNV